MVGQVAPLRDFTDVQSGLRVEAVKSGSTKRHPDFLLVRMKPPVPKLGIRRST
jgi:hypothetical protein